MKETNGKKILIVSVVSFAASSISFLLIPISNFNGNIIQRCFSYMVGIMFWIGLIIGLISTFRLGNIRKKSGYFKHSIPGILCFFKTKTGKVFDIMMLASLALFIAARLMLTEHDWIWLFMLSVLMFSLTMHSIFNGKNYFFVVQKGVK